MAQSLLDKTTWRSIVIVAPGGFAQRFNNCLLAAAVGVALALPSIDAANATPVNYTFSVTAGDGPLAGTTAAGTFSYDTSSIVLNGTNPSTGLLTALNFTWDGIT